MDARMTPRMRDAPEPERSFEHRLRDLLAKCTFWWFASMPFLSTLGGEDAMRNSILLATVCGVYFWRAKTEEKHLMADPDYRAYAAWIAEHGLLAQARRALGI